MAAIQKIIKGLENNATYFARIFPQNTEGYAQSELEGQVASATPLAGTALSTFAEGTVIMVRENGVYPSANADGSYNLTM